MKQQLVAGTAIALTVLGANAPALAQSAEMGGQPAQLSQVEEIYIARSVRLSRVNPTDFCAEARSGFKAYREDQYKFHATATRPSDGRMVETNGKTIASGHGCYGKTAGPAVDNFYLELQLGNTALKGIGECRQTKADFPEQGLGALRCFLDLSDPLGSYIGGQLTTNSMFSRQVIGVASDPPGYVQPSIATIRLWKKRL